MEVLLLGEMRGITAADKIDKIDRVQKIHRIRQTREIVTADEMRTMRGARGAHRTMGMAATEDRAHKIRRIRGITPGKIGTTEVIRVAWEILRIREIIAEIIAVDRTDNREHRKWEVTVVGEDVAQGT
jgi:hypothetical protein